MQKKIKKKRIPDPGEITEIAFPFVVKLLKDPWKFIEQYKQANLV